MQIKKWKGLEIVNNWKTKLKSFFKKRMGPYCTNMFKGNNWCLVINATDKRKMYAWQLLPVNS